MPFSFAVSSVSSLQGTVSTEGGNAPECSSRQPFHLCHVEVLQGGAGRGKSKESRLPDVVTAAHRELAKTREGSTESGQAGVGDGTLAQVQGAKPDAAARQAGQAGEQQCHFSGSDESYLPGVCYEVATTQVEVAELVAKCRHLDI